MLVRTEPSAPYLHSSHLSQFLLSIAIYFARAILVDVEIVQVNDPARPPPAAPAAATPPPPKPSAPEPDPEAGRGLFHRMRGKGGVVAPGLPTTAPSQPSMPSRASELGGMSARNPPPGVASPYDAAVASSISSNPWGPPQHDSAPPAPNGGVRANNFSGNAGAGW